MRTKICGITNLSDALAAIQAGADALGFVFYTKSPRYITPENAKIIIKQLPPFVQCVGLFVNQDSAQIDQIAKESKIDIAQIHFDIEETELAKLQTKYLLVKRIAQESDLLTLKPNQYYLIDAFVESYGGAGKRINVEWFQNIDCSKLILAGGLNENNLHEIASCGFYGVDVSSSVEHTPGKKDHHKIQAFIQKANEIC